MSPESPYDSDPRLAGEVEQTLRTERLARPLFAYTSVDSTSRILKEMGAEGAQEGTTVIARTQTAGVGRRGRPWVSAADKGVYMSILLRPVLSATDIGWMAILGGVAVLHALSKSGVGDLTLKWPNDVLAGGRKVSGVLAEPRIGRDRVDFVVLGIGVNVAQNEADWPGDLKRTATSCHMEGSSANRGEIAGRVLTELERCYKQMQRGGLNPLLSDWAACADQDSPLWMPQGFAAGEGSGR